MAHAPTEPMVRVAPGLELAITRGRARVLAVVGRIGSVFLPVEAVLATYSPDPDLQVWGAAAVVTAIWYVALKQAYAAARLSPLALGAPVASALGTLAGLAAISLLNFWLPGMSLAPPQLLMMGAGVLTVSALFEGIVIRSLAFRRRVLVVGAHEGGAELVEELAVHPELPFDCVGLVADNRATATVAGAPVLGGMRALADVVRRELPDLVVLADSRHRHRAFEPLLDTAELGFRVLGLPEFYEHSFGRVPVRHISPVWFMSVLHLYQRPYSRITKRSFDLFFGLVGLALAAPLLAVIALLVRRSGPGPILFRQTRLGERGRPFEILKFRTMVEGAEEPGQAIWAEERDPRVTPIGRVLRKTRLDELPQLWNVVRGNMSIVGPRPERPEFHEVLQADVPFWSRRHLVKPGITGWAQVRQGYAADSDSTAQKLSYDLWYLKNRNLFLDLAIVAKTAGIALSGTGAR